MVLENLQVRHKAFGIGSIVENSGKYIKVDFGNTVKTFVYPDIFEKFLTLADGTVSDEILDDLHVANEAKNVIIENKKRENLHSMTHGIVIPGKDLAGLDSEDEDNNKNAIEPEEI